MSKKKCPRCKEKIKNSYEFCPSCGFPLQKNSKNKHGLLGKNDYVEEDNFSPINSGFGGFSGKIIDKMLGNFIKIVEKEIIKGINEPKSPKNFPLSNTRIKLMINGKEVTPNIGIPKKQTIEKTNSKKLPIEFSKENLKKFKKMKKVEPSTSVRRIGDKLTYELRIPGVKSINDISISKMEEGIEIKAVGNKKAYSKNINIDLPLLKYMLSKGILSLEMDTKE